MTRITSYASNAQLMRYMFATQARMHTYQLQVNSEKKSQNYAGIATDSQFLVNMETARDSIFSYMKSNETMDFRLQISERATDGMRDVIREFMTTLKNRQLGSDATESDIRDIQRWAFDSMVSLESQLNTVADGRYIYSGGRVTTESVEFNLSSLGNFQNLYDGKTVTYSNTREMHISDYSASSDTVNSLGLHLTPDNWLTFRRDDDANDLSGGDGSIEASSAMFSNLVTGSSITVGDSANNDGMYTVKSVSSDGTKVTVNVNMFTDEVFLEQLAADETLPGALVDELNIAGTITESVSGDSYAPGATTDLTFDNAGATITAAVAGTLNGLAAGEIFEVTGTALNDGTYVVDSIDGTDTIVTASFVSTTMDINDGTQLDGGDFGTLAFDQTAGTITSTVASAFSTISAESIIEITNTANNDGRYTVDGVSTDGQTIDVRLVGAVSMDFGNDGTISSTGGITFDRSGDTITAVNTGTFDGLVEDDVLTITGSGENNGTFVVTDVSDDGTTLTVSSHKLTDEGLISGNTFFNYDNGTKAVFDATANTIEIQDSASTALGSIFSDLQEGDSLVISGTDVSAPLYTQVDYVVNGGTADDTIQILDFTSTAVAGAFSEVVVGDTIDIAGNVVDAANDNTYTVNWISEDGSQIRVDEDLNGAATETTSISIAPNTVTGDFVAYTSAPEFLFENLGGTSDRISLVEDDGATLIANGFDNLSVGMEFTMADGPHDGTYTITAVDASGFIDVELDGADPGFTTAQTSTSAPLTTFTASGNDGTYTVESVSSDGSTVTFSGSTQLVADQTDADGTNFSASGYDYTSGTKLYMDDSAETIKAVQKGSGSTVTNVFDSLRDGQTFTVSGAGNTSNNTAFTISSIAAGVITVNEDITVSESDPNAVFSVYAASGSISGDSYYQGDNIVASHRLDESRNFDLDTNALDPAFEKAIRAMGIVAQGIYGTEGGLDQNTDRITDAIYLLSSSLNANVGGTPPYGDEDSSNLNEMGIDLSFKRVLIQETTEYHEEYIVFASDRIANRENVDMLDAVAHMLDESTALEAAYAALSRIQGLSLANYL